MKENGWRIARQKIKWMKIKERMPGRIYYSVKRHDNRPFASLGSSKSFQLRAKNGD